MVRYGHRHQPLAGKFVYNNSLKNRLVVAPVCAIWQYYIKTALYFKIRGIRQETG